MLGRAVGTRGEHKKVTLVSRFRRGNPWVYGGDFWYDRASVRVWVCGLSICIFLRLVSTQNRWYVEMLTFEILDFTLYLRL